MAWRRHVIHLHQVQGQTVTTCSRRWGCDGKEPGPLGSGMFCVLMWKLSMWCAHSGKVHTMMCACVTFAFFLCVMPSLNKTLFLKNALQQGKIEKTKHSNGKRGKAIAGTRTFPGSWAEMLGVTVTRDRSSKETDGHRARSADAGPG